MTEQLEGKGDADAPNPAAGDQVDGQESEGTNLEAAVEKAAKKQQRERVSLDSFTDPETRDLVQKYTSQQLNEFRRKKVEEGELFTQADVERVVRKQLRDAEKVAEVKVLYRETVAEFGLKRGTEDYEKFEAEANSGIYNLTALGDPAKIPALVEKIAKNAQVGKFKPKVELPANGLPLGYAAGTPLRVDKDGKPVVDPIDADFAARMKASR